MRAPAAPARQRGFFDFSMSELAIIFSVALVVLGPKKLPGLVQQVGRWVGRARHMARQFREQLEQEVNSINEVKPVPRNVPPEVGPTAPTGATAETHTGVHATDTAATGVVESPTLGPEANAALPEAPPEQTHPEAQIYFAMNGSEPEVVARDPHAPQPVTAEPPANALPGENEAGATAAPAAAKIEEPQQPASVEVIFPHDHG